MVGKKVGKIELGDTKYPLPLKQIKDPPKVLYYKGDCSLMSDRCLGVVGSRKMSIYGSRVIRDFFSVFPSSSFCVVSGFMYGVDAEALKALDLDAVKTEAVAKVMAGGEPATDKEGKKIEKPDSGTTIGGKGINEMSADEKIRYGIEHPKK